MNELINEMLNEVPTEILMELLIEFAGVADTVLSAEEDFDEARRMIEKITDNYDTNLSSAMAFALMDFFIEKIGDTKENFIERYKRISIG